MDLRQFLLRRHAGTRDGAIRFKDNGIIFSNGHNIGMSVPDHDSSRTAICHYLCIDLNAAGDLAYLDLYFPLLHQRMRLFGLRLRDTLQAFQALGCVCPGSTLTPLHKTHTPPETIAKKAKQNPMGRLGEPEDMAYATLFLASDYASYINCAELTVDGGGLYNYMDSESYHKALSKREY